MRIRFLSVLFFLSQLFFLVPSGAAQHGDTLPAPPDTSRSVVRQSVKKEFERWRDSMEAVRIKQEVARNGKPLDVFLQKMQERERAQKRQLYWRIGLGVLFLTALAVGLARRRKSR